MSSLIRIIDKYSDSYSKKILRISKGALGKLLNIVLSKMVRKQRLSYNLLYKTVLE